MATLGDTTTPTGGYIYNDYGSGYQYWIVAGTMPAGGGVATDIYIYVGGDGTSFTGKLCIWNNVSPYPLLWSGSITFPSNSRTNGGQQWLHLSVPNIYVPAGSVALGWWAGGNVIWSQEGSGTVWRSNNSVGSSPTNLSGGINAGQATGAYIKYNPAGATLRRSSAWSNIPSKRRAGTTWNTISNKRRKAGAWVNVT